MIDLNALPTAQVLTVLMSKDPLVLQSYERNDLLTNDDPPKLKDTKIKALPIVGVTYRLWTLEQMGLPFQGAEVSKLYPASKTGLLNDITVAEHTYEGLEDPAEKAVAQFLWATIGDMARTAVNNRYRRNPSGWTIQTSQEGHLPATTLDEFLSRTGGENRLRMKSRFASVFDLWLSRADGWNSQAVTLLVGAIDSEKGFGGLDPQIRDALINEVEALQNAKLSVTLIPEEEQTPDMAQFLKALDGLDSYMSGVLKSLQTASSAKTLDLSSLRA